MSDYTLEDLGKTVHEFRVELEKKDAADKEKVAKIQQFFDSYEEKVAQPIEAARQLAEKQAAELTELREKYEAAGVAAIEAKARVDAIELQLARRSTPEARTFRDCEEYKALNALCRVGWNRLPEEQKALLRTDDDAAGGFLVTSEMDSEITKKITEIDGVRRVARVRTIGAKSLDIPIRNTIPVAAYEGEAESGTDSVSSYKSVQVTPYRQTFTSPVTQDQLKDSAFDMTSEIMEDANEAFGYGEGYGFILGSGVKQPSGIFTNATLQAGASQTAAAGVLDAEALLLLPGQLKVGYNLVWLLNRRTLATIRTMRADAVSAGDAKSAFLWQPGLDGPASSTIAGYPYVLCNSVPDIAAGAYSLALGDFRRGYTIVDRAGLSVIRDDFTRKKEAIVEFTFNRWNTGQVTLTEAIKLLKIHS